MEKKESSGKSHVFSQQVGKPGDTGYEQRARERTERMGEDQQVMEQCDSQDHSNPHSSAVTAMKGGDNRQTPVDYSLKTQAICSAWMGEHSAVTCAPPHNL